VRSISGFSAHADEHELEAWLAHFGRASADGGAPKSVFIVHGDPDAAEAFATRIRDSLHLDAHIARHRETVTLT
jgi:metallo-beta-lactamase family protein